MKYVISDKMEVATGTESTYHADIASGFKGKVVRAGHYEALARKQYRVWGSSIGYSIDARFEDADLLACPRKEVSACCHARTIESFRDNPRDHHDPVPTTICTDCRHECDLVEIITA